MVVQLHKSGNTFSFTLPPQAVEEFAFVDGSAIEIQPIFTQAPLNGHVIRYATLEEARKAYEDTRPEFDEVYRELAK